MSINNINYGTSSLNNNTGNENSAFGSYAAHNNLDGSCNTAVGSNSLFHNTIGSYNTSVGAGSLTNNDVGSRNTAVGSSALQGVVGNQSVGNRNTAVGAQALYSNTGDYNTGIGTYAALDITSGNYNTFLGANTTFYNTANTYEYSTALGYGAAITSSSQIMMGKTNTNVMIPGTAQFQVYNPDSYNDLSVVSKQYVDSVAGGLTPSYSCLCATTASINDGEIPSGSPPTTSTDDVTIANGDYVLVINQGGAANTRTNNVNNGLWIVNLSGQWSRPPNGTMSEGTSAVGDYNFIQSGTRYGSRALVQINISPTIVGTDLLQYTLFYQLNVGTGEGLNVTSQIDGKQILSVDSSLNFINYLDNSLSGTINIGAYTTNTIIGPTGGNGKPVIITNGITGPTGSFSDLYVSGPSTQTGLISAPGGITGPRGSFTNINVLEKVSLYTSGSKGLFWYNQNNANTSRIYDDGALTIYTDDNFFINSASTTDINSLNTTLSGNLNVGSNTNITGNLNLTSSSSIIDFPDSLGQKIVLWGNSSSSSNNYGLGIQTSVLQIYSDSSTTRVGIGFGRSSSFTETLSVRGSNVGIGTTSPAFRLDVNGNARITGNVGLGINSNNDYILDLSGNMRMQNRGIIFANDSSGNAQPFLWPRENDNVTYLNYGSAGFNIRNNGSTSRMFITDGGNVGIGTTSPSKQFSLGDNGSTQKLAIFDGGADWFYGFGANNSMLHFSAGTTNNANGQMVLTTSGRVGIGTTSPAYTLDVTGNARITGAVSLTNNSDSNSTTSGALIVTGGAGIGGALNVGNNARIGGTLDVSGITSITNNSGSNSTTNGALIVEGGVGIGRGLNVGNNAGIGGTLDVSGITSITSNTSSTSTTDGALIVRGGVGIGGALNVGGAANITGNLNMTGLIDFPDSLGQKIVLWGNNGSDNYGFGVQNNLLQIHAPSFQSDRVGIGFGRSSSFTETLSVRGSNVGIGTISPSFTLDVSGNARISGNVGLGINSNNDYRLDVSGNMRFQNNNVTWANNASGTAQQFLTPRGNDNVTYLNYGSAGFNIRNNGSTSRMFITDGGNVGIGTTTPGHPLDVNGTCRATTFVSGSDYRLKTNIKPLLRSIDDLKPLEYDLGEKHDMGFIAHEVQEVFPFLVHGTKDGTEMQSLNYTGFIALLVKEVQELKKENKLIREKLEQM